MTKFKRFIFLILGFLSLFAVASCSSNDDSVKLENTTNNENLEEYPEVNINTEGKEKDLRYSSMTIDTTNTKTTFYVGEEFTYEGLIVKINYLLFVDGIIVGNESIETKNYSINYEEVNTNHVGQYPVYVSFRDGSTVREKEYMITVKSALFETTPEIEYYCGLDVSYNTSASNDPRVKTIYLGSSYSFNKSELTYTLYTRKVNEDGTFTDKTTKLPTFAVTEIESNVDTSKVGTYMVKISYTGNDITIDGVNYKNSVTSFVLVNVINPVLSFEKISTGDTEVAASADKLDLSPWKFKITRLVGTEEVNYSDDLFMVEGVSTFAPGQQTATITFREATEEGNFLQIKVDFNVTESLTHNIIIGDSFIDDMVANKWDEDGNPTGYATKNDKDRIQLGTSGTFYANNISREYKVTSIDGLLLTTRIKVESAANGGYFEVNMSKAGKIVVYVSSTGSGEPNRPFAIYNEEGEAVQEFVTTAYNVATRFEINVSEGGIYRIYGEKTVYVHGCVVAVSK